MEINKKKVLAITVFFLFFGLTITSVGAIKINGYNETKNEFIDIKSDEKTNQNSIININNHQNKDTLVQKTSNNNIGLIKKINKIKLNLVELTSTKLIPKTKLFNNFEIDSTKLNIYSKWKNQTGSYIEKITPISKSPFLIDINGDDIDDIKISYGANLDLVDISELEDTFPPFPFALAMNADIQIERTLDSCISDNDFFELSARVDFPGLIFTEEKSLNVGGFRSTENNNVPKNFKISYKFIPYAIRNLFGLKLNPEFWVSYDPGSIEESEINYIIGINELDNVSGISCELKNNPAKPFNLKFKVGIDKWKFVFDSIQGIFKNSNLSFFRMENNKKIGGSLNFKDIDKVRFDADFNIKSDSANILFYSHNDLDFNLKLFDEIEESFLKTGILIKNGISIFSELKKGSEFSINVNNPLDLIDLSFINPDYSFKAEEVNCKKSGSFDLLLNDLGFDINSELELDLANIIFKNSDLNLLISKISPDISGYFSFACDENGKGLKVGSDVKLSVQDASIESLSTDDFVGFYGLIEIQAGGWINLFRKNNINNVELKICDLAFNFQNLDFEFNNEQFTINGLFDFGSASERILSIQWRKPDLFKFNFDKNLDLKVDNFYFSNPKSWLIEKFNIQELSWNSGRNFIVNVSTNRLQIDGDSIINLKSTSIDYNNGARLISEKVFFEGVFDTIWEEESIFVNVDSKLDWDLTIDTVNFGSWDVIGLLDGDIEINSEWETGESGTLNFASGSNGLLHDFVIEHKGIQLHFGSLELSKGDLTFNWQRGENGFLELINNGIQANLDICEIKHPKSSFKFEIGSINLVPGNTIFKWENNSDILHLNLDSGVDFDIGLIKLSQGDSSISGLGLSVSPGIFDFKWFRNNFKMQVKNSISGFEPKICFQKENELFNIFLTGINSDYKTMTFQLLTENDEIKGFFVDTDGKNCARWLECEYKKGNNYGRKLSLKGLKADGFIINRDESEIYLDGKIGGSRLKFSDIKDGKWHLIADTEWDINGDGEGYFKLISDPLLNIELQSLDLLSNWDVAINTTVYAPSFFNLSWECGIMPLYLVYNIDTDGEEIGHLQFDIRGALWKAYLEGTSFSTEDFSIEWQFLEPVQTSGTIYPGSLLAFQAYLDNELILEWNYP
jgi:hypothetical protein